MKKLYSVRTIILAGSLLLQLSPLCFRSRGAAGDVDLSFDPGAGVNHGVSSIAVQPDGKVLVGGVLTFINDTNRYGSARLNADGSLDSTFIPSSFNPDIGYLGFPYDYMAVTAFAVQSDGKVLVAAYYYEDPGYAYFYSYSITRHNADGSRDASFEPVVYNAPYGYNAFVAALAVQPDGKVVVGGEFTTVLGTNRSGIARLNADGSLDGSFICAVPIYSQVGSVVVQMDGKVMIAGSFLSVNGVARNGLARLNANGSLDSSFVPDAGGSPMTLQPDGKVLLAGYSRLNADGSLDDSFNRGTVGYVRCIVLRPDGKVLIGGDFTTTKGVLRQFVARLYGDSFPPSLNIARSNALVIVSWPSPSTGFGLQQSTDLKTTNWTTPPETVADNGTTKFISVGPTPGNRFYRLFKP